MEEEHHYTSASEPERVSPAITRSMALEALKDGPRGTLVIAGCAVGLLFNGAGEGRGLGWLFFYFVLFMSRGLAFDCQRKADHLL